ncbi:hypothetical protein AB1Y20_021467 [Prymnesium parvum]|uniref:Uncharacterized protein n=1 Tax=Prymnesium parvum TaxID=97485 RepID=A0AB34JK76_PRYPA
MIVLFLPSTARAMLGLMFRRPFLLAAGGACASLMTAAPLCAAQEKPKAVVVVGVSNAPGLGYAIAKRFAQGGMNVGIVGRQKERLEECKAAILKEVPGAQVVCSAADATDPAQCARAFSELAAANGAADALVYNMASRPMPTVAVADLDPERLKRDWATGPYAALLCAQQVLPAMREAGSGSILITGASASLRGNAKFGSFSVAKSGLRVLAQSLAKEVAPEGIHVAHVIIDAMVDMPMLTKFVPDAPPGKLLDTDAAAEVYWNLYQQQKRCYTFEVDVRPYLSQW